MLEQLLATIQETGGPIRIAELSGRVQVQRSALEPMLDLLVRRGLLDGWDGNDVACGKEACGASCGGIQGCPFLGRGLPRTLEIRPPA